ncbi:MAG: glycosyl hydrolase [Bacteroidetes bacterium]|nr:MAG: glycosyl hydrolase [Bacteroidota bacterium]
MRTRFLLSAILCIAISATGFSQKKKKKSASSANQITYNDSLYNAMSWRNIGPFRGGRSLTSTGVVGNPLTYYFGSAGGGVWKTDDAGISWRNISDKFFNATSIGAISVSESDPNVIYVGTGEACVRGVMTSHGDGVYKSTDAGKTWTHIGLEKTMHISEVRIHPANPDIVYVAAQGSAYGPTPDRGVYKSINGGETWDKVHFVDNTSSVSNLSMDMNNPRILYAAYWDTQRTPWFIRSGGAGSGIYKTTDAGKTWKKLGKGLPETDMGKIGVSVSRANSERVYAIIEAEKGGLYRSDDAGESWKLMNSERVIQTRSWYYMHVFADTKNEDLVYVLNAPFMKSIDGGKTFNQVQVPHGDNHDLWINPDNPEVMINSNDGGANISLNAGKSWSSQRNQPTAQFYRVNADNRYPYWLYAGQQDNSTLATPSMANGSGIGWQDWIAGIGGNEAAHVAFNPDDPTYIYSSAITGMIDEHNLKTRKQKSIKPYPIWDLGEPSDEMKYRYNWNPPVMVSQHDPEVIYYASNVLHRSTNRAQKWDDISPDLTKNDTTHLGLMGGPITNEAAGGEIYHTIMTIAESPHDASIIWTGADDGSVHLTSDGGQNWQNVSPGPEGIINSIDVSPHDANTVYISLMRYKFNDFKSYIYKSTNSGQSWTNLSNGIPEGAYARVVREDPNKKGLLYAGTERGVYISFDAAASWKPLKLNLPMVPITDLKVHHDDLLAATHGRAFWILDDLTPLQQLSTQVAGSNVYLYKPRDVINAQSFGTSKNPTIGTNPNPGAGIKYYLKDIPKKDTIELVVNIKDGEGNLLRTYSSSAKKKNHQASKMSGMNVLFWDLNVEPIKVSQGIMPAGPGAEYPGYTVGPGTYTVELSYGENKLSQSVTVKVDPRDVVSTKDLEAKDAMVKLLYEEIDAIYRGLDNLQEVREQINQMTKRMPDDIEINEMGDDIKENINSVESELISPKQKTFQDIINYRNMLDYQLNNLMQTINGNTPPITEGEKTLSKELMDKWKGVEIKLNGILNEDISNFNQLLKDKDVQYIAPSEKEDKEKEKSSS